MHSAYVLEGPHNDDHIAIKIIDLERFPDHNLENILKEVQIMRLSSHPNILNYYVCFISHTKLWMVMPLMDYGSIAGILKFRYPQGFEDEVLVATVLREVLKGLSYFHEHNELHRDVKAGNILLGSDGTVHLGDFGVASKLRFGNRATTLAGTPCWMAPEVIEAGLDGYDSKADIWSFGITAIELVKGVPPLIEYPPMKVILLIRNSDPPHLGKDDEFDSSFKDIVNSCLHKDPEKRPTAEVLLKKKFFSKARGSQYILENLIPYLPPVETMISSPVDFEGINRNRNSSEAESWDFNISSGNVRYI